MPNILSTINKVVIIIIIIITLCKLFLRLPIIRSRLSATRRAWFSISCMAMGSIGGMKSGLWGYEAGMLDVIEVATVDEAKLSMLAILSLIRLDRRLLTVLEAEQNSHKIYKVIICTIGQTWLNGFC